MGPRRPGVTSLVVVVVSVAAAALSACGRSPQPAVLATIDAAHPGPLLPEDYLGLSFEASVLDSRLLDPAHSNLPSLLGDLGVGRLRFGGNSLDRVAGWVGAAGGPPPSWAHSLVTPEDLRRLGALSAVTGWPIDLGLTLGHFDPAAAADEAAAARRAMGAGLGSVDIGNEPDLLAHDPTVEPAGYSYARYRTQVDAYRAAISAEVPDLAVAGPDTAGPDWLAAFGHDEHAGLAFLTQHFYPLTRCDHVHPTIADLTSAATTRSEQRIADAAVAAARSQGLSVRLDETNSASCGGQDGVSNTLAAALWMVNYLLLVAQRGVAGVNVHGGLAVCRGYTPLCVPGATAAAPGSAPGIDPVADASLGAGPDQPGRLAAQPDFYALLFVHLLEGGHWLPVRSNRSTPVDDFALEMPDGSIRVALDNPDPRRGTTVIVRAAGHRGPASVLRLVGPSLDATASIEFGGSEVGIDGTWQPRVGPPLAAGAGGVRVNVGPASAALVTLPAP